MEAGALNHTSAVLPGIAARSPLLRLKGDEQLIEVTRRGNQGAFEVLVQRYQSRLLAFCRHMLGSTEDAEDILQEVFAAAYNAMIADSRPINARPWLYRIARNRCLNHLRRPVSAGQDSMDVFERDGGATTADTVHKREEFRQIVADVQELPETQRTALLLREIDALSYDDISTAMDTTVPSVKSLLVRARVSLAEAAEARLLTCDEVRLELGEVAEGLAKTTAPVRRHLKGCERCRVFRGELRRANRALAAVYPLGPLVVVKKFLATKIGIGAGTTAGSGSGAGLAGGAAAAGGASAASAGAGSVATAGLATFASKAAAGLAAAAIVTAGAVETRHVDRSGPVPRSHEMVAQATPTVVQAGPQFTPKVLAPPAPLAPTGPADKSAKKTDKAKTDAAKQPATTPAQTQPTTPVAQSDPNAQQTPPDSTSTPPQQPTQPTPPVQQDGSTVALDGSSGSGADSNASGPGQQQTSPPGESTSSAPGTQPAPVVGEQSSGQPPPSHSFHVRHHRPVAHAGRAQRHRRPSGQPAGA